MADDDWIAVGNGEQWSELLDLSLEFHDAFSAEARWIGPECLTASRSVALHGYGTLHVRAFSQFAEVPYLELRFGKCRRFQYRYEDEHSPHVSFSPKGVLAKILQWELEAETFDYRKVANLPPVVED